jgi:polyhydroxybutyrate depolymerase
MPEVTGLNELSERKGFLAVYPQGTGPEFENGTVAGAWNAGVCCGAAMEENVDDVAFFSELLDRLLADFHVDTRRVYATGISNGSQMSFRLACDLAGRIAAIAPTGAPGAHTACAPARPVPVMYFHGTADPCAPYEGGEECGGCLHEFLRELCGLARDPDACRQDLGDAVTFPCEPAEKYIRAWSVRNGCPEDAIQTFRNGKATCVSRGPCEDDTEVVLCIVEDMGHTWPGGTNGPLCTSGQTPGLCSRYEDIVGPISNDIVASEAMWDFFERHAIPEPGSGCGCNATPSCSGWVLCLLAVLGLAGRRGLPTGK